jgi:hypothetical protein
LPETSLSCALCKKPFHLYPPPASSQEEKGQNCSVPLCSTPQFSQLINAALFVPHYFPNQKPNLKSAGLKKLAKKKRKHGTVSKGYHSQTCPASCRSGLGQGLVNPHTIPCSSIYKKSYYFSKAHVFKFVQKCIHQPF